MARFSTLVAPEHPECPDSIIEREYSRPRDIIIIIVMSVFLERFSMRNMLNCAEQVQIQK